MSDSQLAYAVTYLLSFRLAIVVLGGLSIYLGYRLFTHALSPSGRGADADTEISGRFKDAEITLPNATLRGFTVRGGAARVGAARHLLRGLRRGDHHQRAGR